MPHVRTAWSIVPMRRAAAATSIALALAALALPSGSARAGGAPDDAGPDDDAGTGSDDAGADDDAGTTRDAGRDSGPPAPREVACPELARIEATYPADGATGVPRNASIRVRYGAAAEMTGVELITLRDARNELVGGVVTNDVRELSFTPSALLAPGTYTAGAPALDGGPSTLFQFTVADTIDAEPPTLGTPVALRWNLVEIEGPCDTPSGSRYELFLQPRDLYDDSGAEHLELRVFRVGRPGTPAREVERVPARTVMDALPVRLPQNQAVGHVCFSLATRDLTGAIGTNGEQACFDTIAPPFWDGCSATGPAPSRSGAPRRIPLAFLGVAVAATIGARRRARRRNARG